MENRLLLLVVFLHRKFPSTVF